MGPSPLLRRLLHLHSNGCSKFTEASPIPHIAHAFSHLLMYRCSYHHFVFGFEGVSQE